MLYYSYESDLEEKEKKKENEQQQQPMGRNFWNFSRNYTKNKKGGKCLFEVNYKSTEVVNCNHIKKEGRFQCFYLMRCKYKRKKKGKEFFVFFLLKIFSHLKMYAPHFPIGTRWGVGDLCVAVVFVVLSRQVDNCQRGSYRCAAKVEKGFQLGRGYHRHKISAAASPCR